MNSIDSFVRHVPVGLDAPSAPESKTGAAESPASDEDSAGAFGEVLSGVSKREDRTTETECRSKYPRPETFSRNFLLRAASMASTERDPSVAGTMMRGALSLAIGDDAALSSSVGAMIDGAPLESPRVIQGRPTEGASEAADGVSPSPRLAARTPGSVVAMTGAAAKIADGETLVARTLSSARSFPVPAPVASEPVALGSDLESWTPPRRIMPVSALPLGAPLAPGSSERKFAPEHSLSVETSSTSSDLMQQALAAALSPAPSAYDGAPIQGARQASSQPEPVVVRASEPPAPPRSRALSPGGASFALAPLIEPADAMSGAKSSIQDARARINDETLVRFPAQGQLIENAPNQIARREIASGADQATDVGLGAGRLMKQQADPVAPLTPPSQVRQMSASGMPLRRPEASAQEKSDLAVSPRIRVTTLDQQAHLPPAAGLSPIQQIADRVAVETGVGASNDATGAKPSSEAAAAATLGSAVKILNLRLEPESLGVVTIRMRLSGARLELQLEAARPETIQLIDNDKNLLVERLRASGYAMDNLVVKAAEHAAAIQINSAPPHSGGDPSAGQGSAQMSWLASAQDKEFDAYDQPPTPRDRGPSRSDAAEDPSDGAGGVGAGVYI